MKKRPEHFKRNKNSIYANTSRHKARISKSSKLMCLEEDGEENYLYTGSSLDCSLSLVLIHFSLHFVFLGFEWFDSMT